MELVLGEGETGLQSAIGHYYRSPKTNGDVTGVNVTQLSQDQARSLLKLISAEFSIKTDIYDLNTFLLCLVTCPMSLYSEVHVFFFVFFFAWSITAEHYKNECLVPFWLRFLPYCDQ